jgi:hypothetical protein
MAASLLDAHFKVLGDNQQSHHGGTGKWRKNAWRTVNGTLAPCSNGIHYCQRGQLVHWLGPTIWLFEDGAPDETIDHGDKMVTRKGRIVEQVTTWNETTARLFAADVAEVALQFIPGTRQEPFVAAINAARGFARGEISDKERAAAWDAARAAARAAAGDAAGDAAWAAARAAAGAAAGDAARAAARAAARDAARAAAWAAARAAAWDAAGAAAWDAARDAARAAAWDAARAAAWDAARAAAWDAARAAAWDAARAAAWAAAGAAAAA